MNVLMDDLPCTVIVADVEIPIDTDYRTGILFEQTLSDPAMPDNEKLNTVLKLYYGDAVFPLLGDMDTVQEALNGIMWFYRCGADETAGSETEGVLPVRIRRFLMNMMPVIFTLRLWKHMELT